METFTIASTVASLVQAFTASVTLFRDIRAKRKEKAAQLEGPKFEELAVALTRGGPEIQQEYDEDFSRLGPRFARGDEISVSSLQSVIIRLQGDVIQGLLQQNVLSERVSVLETMVARIAAGARSATQDSVGTLAQLYQRLMTAAPVGRALPAPQHPFEGCTMVMRSGLVLKWSNGLAMFKGSFFGGQELPDQYGGKDTDEFLLNLARRGDYHSMTGPDGRRR